MRFLVAHPITLGHTLRVGHGRLVSETQPAPVGQIFKPFRGQDSFLWCLFSEGDGGSTVIESTTRTRSENCLDSFQYYRKPFREQSYTLTTFHSLCHLIEKTLDSK